MTSRGAHAAMADNLGFAIPVTYVKDFLRNREAFSFDKDNPNSGYRYLDPPRRLVAGRPEGLKAVRATPRRPRRRPHGESAGPSGPRDRDPGRRRIRPQIGQDLGFRIEIGSPVTAGDVPGCGA